MYADIMMLDESIDNITEKIKNSLDTHPAAQRLMKITGIGPLACRALLDLGDGRIFSKGRDFAASLGLVPRLEHPDPRNFTVGC